MREIYTPARLNTARRGPPEALIIDGKRKVGLRAKDADWRRTEYLSRNDLRLFYVIENVRKAAVVLVAECQGARANR